MVGAGGKEHGFGLVNFPGFRGEDEGCVFARAFDFYDFSLNCWHAHVLNVFLKFGREFEAGKSGVARVVFDKVGEGDGAAGEFADDERVELKPSRVHRGAEAGHAAADDDEVVHEIRI